MKHLTDKSVEEATCILRALDTEGRAEALQWLRGYAAGQAGADRAPGRVIAWPGPANASQGIAGSNEQEG